MALARRIIGSGPRVGADAPPRRVTKRCGKLTIGKRLVSGNKRRLDQRAVYVMFGKAAFDGQRRASATAFGARAGHRKSGVIYIAETHAVDNHRVNGAADLRRLEMLKLATGETLQHLAKTLR